MKIIDNFEIEDLGIQDNYVYDIEVDNNHNFFANDILVHNSVYFTIETFMEKYYKGTDDVLEKTKWADNFYKKVIEKIIQKGISVFAERLNLKYPEFIGVEREAIADKGFFVAKKMYSIRVFDMEGKLYPADDPYEKTIGLELIKGGTAPFSKKYLKQSIDMILDKSETEIADWVRTLKDEFMSTNLINIARTTGISKLENPEWGTKKEGRIVSIPSGSKAGIATNDYIINNNLSEEYPLISPGEKAKTLYLKPHNPLKNDRFAFLNNKFAELFRDYIDYDTNWEKYFLKPLKNMTDPLGLKIDHKTEGFDEW